MVARLGAPTGLIAKVSPVRILHVMEATIGGTKRHLLDLTTSMDREAFDVEVACPAVRSEAHGDVSFSDDLRDAGITVQTVPMVRALNPFADTTTIRRLWRILRNGRYDIVHTHSTKAGITGRFAAQFQARTVHTPHGFYYLNFSNSVLRGAARSLERTMGAITDRVIALSESEHREAVNLLGPSRVRLVPNGFDLFAPLPKAEARKRLGLKADGPVVGTTSRFTAQKAPFDVVEAFRVIHEAQPETQLLWINSGELREAVEQRLATLGLLTATVLPGYTPDARIFLSAMDVFLHLARWEGVPYAVMEAMVAGVPVVGAHAVGTADLIDHNRTGLLVDPGSGPAAGRAALELLTQTDRARTIARSGVRAMHERPNRDGMVRATEAVYRELVQTT